MKTLPVATNFPNKTNYNFNNKHENLTTFVLKDINKRMYFKTSLLRKHYTKDFLNVDKRTAEDMIKSIATVIGHLISELSKLGLIEIYSNTRLTTWKNPLRTDFIRELNKAIKNNENKIKKLDNI